MNNVNCYLCGSKDFEKLEGVVRDNPSLDVLLCKNCSLVFLSSTEHIEDGFYENDGMHCGAVDVDNWRKQTREDDKRRFKFLKKQIEHKNILDFGCGNGGFLSMAQKTAKNSVGVELQKSLKEFYAEKNLKVFSSIEEVSEKFDYITLFHVLEHIKNPIALLKQLAGSLNKAGELIIEVPNSNDALLSIYKNSAFMNFTHWSCHLFLFNEQTIQEVVKQAGFKVNYIKHVQRYGFCNHLYWQLCKKPGGHKKLWFMNCKIMNKLYEKSLAQLKATDTILVSISID